MSDDVEKRVRTLENKVLLATGALAVFVVWMGVTSYYSIPKWIEEALKSNAAMKATEEISVLLGKAKLESENISRLTASGTIIVGGRCYKTRVIYRCYRQRDGHDDHMTWFENKGECDNAHYIVEDEVRVLAQCEPSRRMN